MKRIEVSCPHCKKRFNYHDSEFRPFCSEKCRLIDLGQWLDEAYTVPVEKLTEEEFQTIEQLLNDDEKEQNADD